MFNTATREGAGTNVQESMLPPVASVAPISTGFAPLPPVSSLGQAPPLTAEEAEQAAPNVDRPRTLGQGASVVMYRGGPGDQPSAPAVDDWLEIYRDVPHGGVQDGKSYFAQRPPVPPEGHGGYDVQGDYGQFIDRATQTQFLAWSDWAGSTALQAGGRGSFTGEHVIIQRVTPGSYRGYMPAEMVGPNVDRNAPPPWDAAITVGQGG